MVRRFTVDFVPRNSGRLVSLTLAAAMTSALIAGTAAGTVQAVPLDPSANQSANQSASRSASTSQGANQSANRSTSRSASTSQGVRASQIGSDEITLATEPKIENREQWAVELLRLGNWPITGQNVCAVVGWELAEGGHFVPGSTTFNPLNTSQSMPGATVFNSHGVKNYPDWATGLIATVKTMRLGFYNAIRGALDQGNNGNGVLSAVFASVWGTKHGSVPAGCLVKAQLFDEKRVAIEEKIASEEQALTADQANLAKAQADQAKLEQQFKKDAPKVQEAKRLLSQLARQLYVQSAEPNMISLVDGITSGDPVAYAVVDDYVRRASDRDGNRVAQAVNYLTQVQGQLQASRDEVAKLEQSVKDRQQAIEAAEAELANLAAGILGGS